MQPPPEWCAEYVGVPYVPKGLDLDTGVDCWGLVFHVLRQRFGCDVPSYTDLYVQEAANAAVEDVTRGPTWREVSNRERQAGDVLWFRSLRGVAHVGVVVSRDYFMHCNIGSAVVVARIELPFWASRLLGVYRFNGEQLADG